MILGETEKTALIWYGVVLSPEKCYQQGATVNGCQLVTSRVPNASIPKPQKKRSKRYVGDALQVCFIQGFYKDKTTTKKKNHHTKQKNYTKTHKQNKQK